MRYDLHVHSAYSSCSLNPLKSIVKRVRTAGLDGIALTDHNTIKGALKLAKMRKGFDLILGEEVMTDRGEVLAYGLTEEVRPGSFLEVIDEIHSQGGITSLAHPFSASAIWRKHADLKHLDDGDLKKLDAIEAFNARCIRRDENSKASRLADSLGLAKTAGSDAHFPLEIGRGVTVFEGDLFDAIKKRGTSVTGHGVNPLGWRLLSLPVKMFRSII